MTLRLSALCLLALPAPLTAQAQDLALAFPVDCTLGETCHIQQFVDRDAGPGARDFTCGSLSYDGHKGTDFALATEADLAADVAVLAAAPGVVRGVRDGMVDIAQGTPEAPDITDRDCGNGVVIDHGDGWETQYCHLRQGSVTVASGDRVETGDVLGAIGLSGNTEFPHLHLSVRRDGAVIDPFALGDVATCGEAGADLWSEPLPYTPGALLDLGWADAVPDYAAVKAGTADDPEIAVDDPALVLWAFAFGARAGDTLALSFAGPNGESFETEATIERDQARFFRAGGRRTPDGGWPAGDYVGRVEFRRGGQTLDAAETRITLD